MCVVKYPQIPCPQTEWIPLHQLEILPVQSLQAMTHNQWFVSAWKKFWLGTKPVIGINQGKKNIVQLQCPPPTISQSCMPSNKITCTHIKYGATKNNKKHQGPQNDDTNKTWDDNNQDHKTNNRLLLCVCLTNWYKHLMTITTNKQVGNRHLLCLFVAL